MPIRLQVLGGLHAFRDDVPLAWVPAQHVSSALLVYLALERDVTREQLARVFWPDEELDSARHALRQALYRLRHAAGERLIEDTGDVLRISVPVACDALQFERAVEAGDFGAAMALYGGAFLKDVSLSASREFEAWVDRQRARFGRLYRRACRARIETLLGGGDAHLALDAARAWATVEPFDDEAQHRLIELLAGSGQRAEALGQYERYERLLKGEELEPLDETKALVALLRAGELGNGAIVPASLPHLAPAAAQNVTEPRLAVGLAPSGAVVATAKLPARTRSRWLGKRWPLAAAAGIVVVSLGVAGVWALWFRPSPVPQVRGPVVVLPFEAQGSDPGLAQLGVQAAEEIAAAIEGEQLGQVVRYRPGRRGEVYTEQVGRKAVAKAGAALLVTGVIGQRGGDIQVQARVIRGSDLSTVWTLGPERSSAADPTVALDALRERVLGAVGYYGSTWMEGWVNPGISQPAPSLDALLLYEKGFELYIRSRWADAIPLIRQAFARDTTWLVPAGGLVGAYSNLGRWQERDSMLAFLEARRERLYRGDALLLLDYHAAILASPEEQVRATLALYSAEPTFADQHVKSLLQARRPAEALKYYALRDTALSFLPDYEWLDNYVAQAYHMLGRFADELAVTRAARARQPRSYRHWLNEVRALAALGRTDEMAAIVRESHTLETRGAAVLLMRTAATELSLHGWTEAARGYAERTLAGLPQRLDSLLFITSSGVTVDGRDIQCDALRILGRYDEAVQVYDTESRRAGTAGLRILAMRDRILMGDTVGALALADSARTQPLSAYGAATPWNKKGTPLYFGAQILSLLGRGDAAVDMLRQALNNGARLGVDEPLEWYWAPIKDYPPFQELVKIR